MIYNDDCLSKLKQLDENSIQALITDPPAGISFMGKDWDSAKDFISNMTEIYKECLRVLKPGAHGLVWAIPRTSHWTATALEQAGFEIRDVITHVFGSGFPKNLDVSKAIDKMLGAEREIIGADPYAKNHPNPRGKSVGQNYGSDLNPARDRTAPSSPEAKTWEGFGTALKPASEHWILIRKPLSETTVAKNVLKHGTGGLNIDASRIEGVPDKPGTTPSTANGNEKTFGKMVRAEYVQPQGRFPANLVLSHNEDCEDECTEGCAIAMLDKQSGITKSAPQKRAPRKVYQGNSLSEAKTMNLAGLKEGGGNFSDTGGASRFFYCAKASKKDRNEGLDGMPEVEVTLSKSKGAPLPQFTKDGKPNKPMRNQNFHPTVKSTKLMEYLITLITPPNGTVLDPFMGSGSTGVAAKRLGFSFVGIEKEKDYFEIAEARLNVYSA